MGPDVNLLRKNISKQGMKKDTKHFPCFSLFEEDNIVCRKLKCGDKFLYTFACLGQKESIQIFVPKF